VPQEPQIFPHLTVAENLLLGEVGDAPGALERATTLAREMGLASDFGTLGGFLSIANQQMIEIIRGLLRNARVLIFDEPTSALTIREVEALFQHLRRLSAQGIGILFISHRLNEVLEISHRASVLRDGVFVLEADTGTLTAGALVEAMLPGTAQQSNGAGKSCPAGARHVADRNELPVLAVESLSGDVFDDVSFAVWPGEVVGLAGLVGAGRTELSEAIVGLDANARGTVRIGGTAAENRTPRRCQELGLAYVPEDRHAHGIFLELPNAHTTTASILAKLGRVFVSQEQERSIARRFVERLGIRVSGPGQIARTLSGGNQQKVVLSKMLATDPRVIILDEPTRGIDAQARRDVYRIIRELTALGVAILLISSELDEVIELSDRILVMYRGRVREMPPDRTGLEAVSAATFGLRDGVP